MATYYNLKGGGTTGVDHTNLDGIRVVVDVPEIIASDATLTANGTLAINDVVGVYQFPIGFVCTGVTAYVHTACDTNVTFSVGDAGSAAGWLAATATTAGTFGTTVVGDAYGADNYCGLVYSNATSTNRTLNVKFLIAACTKGRIILTIRGYQAFKD